MRAKKFKGTVTQYLELKGVGVVTPSDTSSNGNNRNVRFHISDLDVDSVSEGDKLRFSIRKSDGRYEAREPTLIESTNNCDSSQRPTSNPGSRTTSSISTNVDTNKDCTGTVTKYFDEEGYGFATTADLAYEDNKNKFKTTDVFFHISDIEINTVSEGDRLEFDVEETDDGPKAINPTIIERNDTDSNGEIMRTDPSKRLGVSGLKDDTQYGRDDSTTSGDAESFDDERKFR